MRDKKRILDDIYWVKFIGAILLVLCFVLILGYYIGGDIPFKEASFQVVLTLFTTLISILIVGLAYQKVTEGEFNKSIRKNIFDSLAADKSIIQEYKDVNVKKILGNCFSVFYGDTLSEKYMHSVIDNQLNDINYRQDFVYDIDICSSSDPEFAENDRIKQRLSYKRHMPSEQTEVHMQCCFTLSKNELNRQFSNKKLFFREEINCERFRSQLIACKSSKEILESLNMEMSINDRVVNADKISCEFMLDNSVLIISTPVSAEEITDMGEFKSYKGQIFCSYPSVKNDYFYCVFSEPIINASVTLKFSNGVKVDQVNYFSFIPESQYSLNRNTNIHNNNITFVSKGTIFPLSGLIFHW